MFGVLIYFVIGIISVVLHVRVIHYKSRVVCILVYWLICLYVSFAIFSG